jgi:hypothetical protein
MLLANVALMWCQFHVHGVNVDLEIVFGPEGSGAVLTKVRFFFCVLCPNVFLKVAFSHEGFVASLTIELA